MQWRSSRIGTRLSNSSSLLCLSDGEIAGLLSSQSPIGCVASECAKAAGTSDRLLTILDLEDCAVPYRDIDIVDYGSIKGNVERQPADGSDQRPDEWSDNPDKSVFSLVEGRERGFRSVSFDAASLNNEIGNAAPSLTLAYTSEVG